ncbi:hypothetical protein [Geminocystis sp.]|uniref:hypothetical protein n=1 Tax=Geminocystis sp. TaxID=2664100 RepID=UPI0035937B83
MPIRIIFSARTHKESESITDCQDFFHLNSEQNCCAIADGASQSFYPSLWAELLVNHFCQNSDINQENWQLWLKPIQEKWLQEVTEKVETAKRDFNPVWVTNTNRLNRRDSATSTFIGLEFLENKIKVSLVGDSCLFIVKNHQSINTLIASYPLKNSQDFGNRPEYFASYQKNNDFQPNFFDIPFENQRNSEKFYFILATDALSEFIFQCLENDKPIFTKITNIDNQQDFEKFVSLARKETIFMKNDDVALMILEVNNIKILEPLPSINPQKQNNNNLLSPVTATSNEEKEEELISPPLTPNNNNHNNNLQLDQENKLIELAKNYAIKFIEIRGVIQRRINLHLNNRESTIWNEQNQVRDFKKVNRDLKLQRNLLFILALLLPLLSYFIGKNSVNQKIVNSQDKISTLDNSKNINKNSSNNLESSNQRDQNPSDNQNNIKSSTPNQSKINEQKSIEIEVGMTIYKDKELSQILIESTQTKVKAQITQEGENWDKILRTVYAHKSTSNTQNCTDKEITFTKNIRITINPDKNAPLFGTLKQPSQFKNVDINSELTWCKFQFEGYIRK